MTTDHWSESALTNDALVVELLLRIKHSSDSNPLIKSTPIKSSTPILPPLWGNRKIRSKSTPSIAAGFGKEHRLSPTTHLSWSGGAGSTSDGCDDSSRRSDLDSCCRSVKANEGASTSSFNQSHKKKSFIEVIKDEEGPLLKKRTLTKKVSLNDGELKSLVSTGKKFMIKVDSVDQNVRNKTEKAVSFKVEAETESMHKGFVLPDLNMALDEDDLVKWS